MLKVQKKLHFDYPIKAVYTTLVTKALSEFSDQEISKDIIGTKHIKKIKRSKGKMIRLKTEITGFIENELYEITTETENKKFITKYVFEDCGDYSNIIFSELYIDPYLTSKGFLLSLNKAMYKIKSKRRIKKLYKNLTAFITSELEK